MSSLVGVKNISGEITKSNQGNQSVLQWGALPVALKGIPFVSRFVLNEDGEQRRTRRCTDAA